MARMPYRGLLITWARKREKELNYTSQDREDLLGTQLWRVHSIRDIKAYVEILEEEIQKEGRRD